MSEMCANWRSNWKQSRTWWRTALPDAERMRESRHRSNYKCISQRRTFFLLIGHKMHWSHRSKRENSKFFGFVDEIGIFLGTPKLYPHKMQITFGSGFGPFIFIPIPPIFTILARVGRAKSYNSLVFTSTNGVWNLIFGKIKSKLNLGHQLLNIRKIVAKLLSESSRLDFGNQSKLWYFQQPKNSANVRHPRL